MPECNIPDYILFVNRGMKRGVAIYTHVCLNVQLFNTLSNSAFWNLFGVSLIPSIPQRFYWDVFKKSPSTFEQN